MLHQLYVKPYWLQKTLKPPESHHDLATKPYFHTIEEMQYGTKSYYEVGIDTSGRG